MLRTFISCVFALVSSVLALVDSASLYTELTKAKTQLIKGAEHDTSLMQVLLDVLKGDDDVTN